MSTTIDERVLEMKFDNKQFESGVSTTMSTLDKLKQALNLKGASQGLENVNSAASKFNMSGMSDAVDTVKAKFSALQVMGVTALANITNSAVNAGKNIASALTIDPVKDGFQEYETQINSVQTILANTQKEHTNVTQVNAALDELNKYADDTIYNFTEMTRNIGTFTAAGVKLKDSVSSIKGIANLAAVSGSTSQQASTAMYQLSQALAAGKVNLQDWNSVVNAGMGGQVFQDALIRTSEHLKTGAKEAIKTSGTFRESLTKSGWLTTEVLTETLNQISGAYSEADLIAQGYTKDQAKEIADLGKMATEAATQVKTFSQLIDTLKEALGSGWTESWRTVIGDFDEAKELWTEASDYLGGVINKSSDKRNDYLTSNLSTGWDQFIKQGINNADEFSETVTEVAKKHGVAVDNMVKRSGSFEKSLKQGWMTSDILKESVSKTADGIRNLSDKQLEAKGYTKEQAKELLKLDKAIKDGSLSVDEYIEKMNKFSGRENLIKSFKNAFTGLLSVIKPIKEAFTDIFPPLAGQELYDFTTKLVEFTKKLKVSDETAANIKSTFKGVFAVFHIVATAIKAVVKGIGSLFGCVGDLGGGILGVTGSFGEFLAKIDKMVTSSGFFEKAVQGIVDVIKKAVDVVKEFVKAIGEKINFNPFEMLNKILDNIAKRFDSVSDAGSKVGDALDASGMLGTLQSLWDGIQEIAKAIAGGIGNILQGIMDGLGGDGFNGFLDALNTGSLVAIAGAIVKFVKGVKDPLESFGGIKDVLDGVTGVLDGVKGSLEAWQQQLKAGTLIKIAGAIAILAVALVVLSSIPSDKLGNALAGITVMFGELAGMMAFITSLDFKNLGGVGTSVGLMIGIAFSVLILASALKKIGSMNPEQIGYGLVGVLVLMFSLVEAMKALSTDSDKAIKGCGQLILLAIALRILVSSVKALGKLSPEELIKGLAGVGALLAELVIFQALMQFINTKGMLKSVMALVGIGLAMKLFASVFKDFGSMDWESIGKAAASMGIVLGEFVVFQGLMRLINTKGLIKSIVSLIAVAKAMEMFVNIFKGFASMDWESIGKAAASMGIVLGEFVVFQGLMRLVNTKGLLTSVVGLIGVAKAMEIMAGVCQTLGSIEWEGIAKAGVAIGGFMALVIAFSALSGLAGGLITAAAGLLVMGAALNLITPVLTTLGSMSWEEIARGLLALAGAFVILGVAGAVLGPLAPALIALSAAIALMGVGLMAAGIGVTLLAAGILALSTALSAGAVIIVAGLTTIITGIASLIPVLITKLGDCIVAICGVITSSAPAIAEAVKAVVLSLLDVFVTIIPQLVDTLFQLITQLLDALVQYTPQIVEKLATIVIEVLNQLAQKAPEFVGALATLIVNVINALAEKVPEIVNALVNLFGVVIQSLAQALGPLIQNVIVPLVQGIADAISQAAPGIATVVDSITSLVQQLGSSISQVLLSLATAISVAGSSISLVLNSIKGVFQTVFAGIVSCITAAGNSISQVLGSIAGVIQTAFDGVSNVIQTAGDSIAQVFDSIGTTISDTFNGISDVITSVGDAIRNVLDGVSGVMDSIGNAALNAGKGFEQLAKGVETITNLNLVDMGASMAAVAGGVAGIAASASGLSQAGAGMQQILSCATMSAGAFTVMSAAISVATGKLSSIGGAAQGSMATLSASVKSSSTSFKTLSSAASSAVKKVNTSLSSTGSGASSFGSKISSLSKSVSSSMKSMASAVSGSSGKVKTAVSSMMSTFASTVSSKGSAAVTALKGVVSKMAASVKGRTGTFSAAGKSMANALKTGISSGVSSISGVFTKVVNSALNVVRGKASSFASAGSQLSSKFKSGISKGSSGAVSAVKSMVNKCKAAASGNKSKFVSAGKACADGFASGIGQNSFKASAKAKAMASAAAAAAKKALKIHSPSRVFREIGSYVPQGFAIGIDRFAHLAKESASNMARTAVSGTKTALSTLNAAVNSMDVNAQPVITPVLDMSNVNGVIDKGLSIGTTMNLNAISASMRRRAQNGTNADVVSAIEKLRSEVRDLEKPSYNINGITYDNGSQISEAIETLVRAAIVERRV